MLALPDQVGVGVHVDDHVREVHPHHVVWVELGLELGVGEGHALLHELADLLDRGLFGEAERQDHVGDGAVLDLVVDRESVAAPVATGLEGAGSVDDHLGAASRALEGADQIDRCLDVLRTGADDHALERADVTVEVEYIIG